MKLLFIINENAGNGSVIQKWNKLKSKLSVPYKVEFTEYPCHATEIVKKHANEDEQPLLVIAIGGDGTIHEVIQGAVYFSHTIVGAIAAGSGNDFGRGFENFNSVEEIERFLQQPITQVEMDIGILKTEDDRKYFMNSAGYGFDATISKLVNHSKVKKNLNKLGLGKLSYIYFLIKTLFTYNRFTLTLLHNGEEEVFHHVWFVVASNQPYYGGGMKISPKSIPNDGLIELTIVNEVSRLKLLLLFMTVFFGQHTKLKAVKQFTASEFEIIMDEHIIAHTDGEYAGESTKDKPIRFELKSQAWRLARKSS
ncbi:diacylglycerol/lipid kinase family protein [Rummeliibacillus pycnus]|uniref:diacylglycerol/lipid kinase family protein n=1 Tax=Rummeliibacillus pycnus TaxID=101070 RepID=UPI003D283D3F